MTLDIPNPTSRIPHRHARARATFAVVVIALLVFAGATFHAQEGHPLAGTWHGTWGPNATERHDVTLVMDYDGKAITGMVNPGPDAIHFDRATLDPATWAVHIEAAPKGPAAAGAKPIVIDATIDNVTSRHRTLAGTWTQGATKGDFKASRDD